MIVDPAYAATPKPIERILAILAGYRERILMTDSQYGCRLGRLALEIDPENRCSKSWKVTNGTALVFSTEKIAQPQDGIDLFRGESRQETPPN
jgi:hypothetical protein